ncbi:hypothetical protein BJY59DRAFT_704935 [Rhodotorula toruloides]
MLQRGDVSCKHKPERSACENQRDPASPLQVPPAKTVGTRAASRELIPQARSARDLEWNEDSQYNKHHQQPFI